MKMYRCDGCGMLTEYKRKMIKLSVEHGGSNSCWHLCGECYKTMSEYMGKKAAERKRDKVC